MINIHYNHASNLHTLEGPENVLPLLLEGHALSSLLDLGCGEGTWLRTAMKLGIPDVVGVDGVEIDGARLHFPKERFYVRDFTSDVDLERRFDAALCLEVAEHLPEEAAPQLIKTLTRHSDLIFFSAACPQQDGQHHVNCQWPEYWQRYFNECGYVCEDMIRAQIWNNEMVEWWYRQNIFVARKDSELAGTEPRICAMVHPQHFALKIEAFESEVARQEATAYERGVESVFEGSLPLLRYLELPWKALLAKMKRLPSRNLLK